MRIEMHRDAIRALMQNASLVAGRAAATKDACNAETGRDDYQYEVSVSAIRARARVWAPVGEDGHALIRNLGAGG